jgi:hypothetical protein
MARCHPAAVGSALLVCWGVALTQPAVGQAPAPSLGPAIVAEIRAVASTQTSADWRRAHPRDEVVAPARGDRTSIVAGFGVAVALAASATIPLSAGSAARRMLAFYPPPSASLETTSGDAKPEELQAQAVPGYLWLERDAQGDQAAEALIGETRAAIEREFGAGTPDAKVAALGAGMWRHRIL